MEEKEFCIDENFNDFIDNLIGNIDCGENHHYGDEYIIEIEEQRKINAKKGVIALYEAYISDDLAVGPNHLSVMFPNGKMNYFDFERLISYFLLGQFNIINSNVTQSAAAASKRTFQTRGYELTIAIRVHKRYNWYRAYLEDVISNIKQHIETLEETQRPTFDFSNVGVSYKKIKKNNSGEK